jgi:hypothetical protein
VRASTTQRPASPPDGSGDRRRPDRDRGRRPVRNAAGPEAARVRGDRRGGAGSGLLALAARDDRKALRIAALAGAAVDASDAVTFGFAARDPIARRAGIGGVVSGSAAAITGAWAWRRLGGDY